MAEPVMQRLAPRELPATLSLIGGEDTASIVIAEGSNRAVVTIQRGPLRLSGDADIDLDIAGATVGATGWIPMQHSGHEASLALRWSGDDVAGALCLIDELGELHVYRADRPATTARMADTPRSAHTSLLVAGHLVGVLKDAAHGWRVAAEILAEDPRAAECREIAIRREQMAAELVVFVTSRQGVLGGRRFVEGQLYLWWLQLRRLLPGTSSKDVFGICRRGSRTALAEYDQALDEPLVITLQRTLERQRAELATTVAWTENQVQAS